MVVLFFHMSWVIIELFLLYIIQCQTLEEGPTALYHWIPTRLKNTQVC